MTLGNYDYAMLGDTPYPKMAKIVFVLFQILIPILLLNMLIAMMGNTYGIVIESAEKEFLKAWAKVKPCLFCLCLVKINMECRIIFMMVHEE